MEMTIIDMYVLQDAGTVPVVRFRDLPTDIGVKVSI